MNEINVQDPSVPMYSTTDVMNIASCASQARELIRKGENLEDIHKWIEHMGAHNHWPEEIIAHLIFITRI